MSIAKSIRSSLAKASWIREMFEQGQRLKAQYGADQVFDFSLGNPTLEPPLQVHETLLRLIQEPELGMHRYMPNPGVPSVRSFIAKSLRAETTYAFQTEDIVMCVGAGGGLNVAFKALLDPGDEVLTLAPYFVEYGFYAQNHGGVLKVASTTSDFQIDLDAVSEALSPQTKIVLINTPNNPTGVVYSQDSINALGKLLTEKEQEYGHPIFLISDDPYRHILFDNLPKSNVFLAHANTMLITSHSKDLGLAGERIGFIALHPEAEDRQAIQDGLALTTRILGFVNAPALMQRILPHLEGATVSVETYQNLRDLFYEALTGMGFEIVRPQGAFYMFPQSPLPDDVEFVKCAQEERVLLVPGSGFGCPGYFRVSYCFSEEMIRRSFPYFEKLARRFNL